MRFARLVLVVGVTVPVVSVHAVELNENWSLLLNVGAFSEYSSRGISQTQRNPAIQASATIAHSSGLYAGLWTSNVDFGGGLDARQEVDYIAGYLWQPSDKVGLDLGYIKYTYDKSSLLNLSETYAVLTAYDFVLGASYSNDNFGDQSALYEFVGYKVALPYDTALDLRYGRADFKDPVLVSNDGKGSDSYREWEAKLSHDFVGVKWSLSYIDTDLSEAQCQSYIFYKDVCSARFVVGASKSF
ncbi:TorF family putative porin [Pseudomonas sp. NFACC13-1]|uniref:TorF family putative porin n=1 Tax=Pseudomonas sp. NFACC13-1 TaxID=1566245 RepID=UPI000883C1C1|nr:TorF family putative porin [Pseudomonas sp. NFACC13-1]SDB67198.1 conserved hypothetical protein [Pseudomonas sp. NFACC13-1]